MSSPALANAVTPKVAAPLAEPERQSDPGSGVAKRELPDVRAVVEDDVDAWEAVEEVRTSTEPAPPPAPATLSDEAAEQIFSVLSAALSETLLPLLEKQKELEGRLAHVQQVQHAAAQAAAAAPAVATPVAIATASASPRPSVVPTTYGFVTASQAPMTRPEIEVALERVGPVDVPDFGRGRRSAGTILVGLMLAAVIAAIAATILSHT